MRWKSYFGPPAGPCRSSAPSTSRRAHSTLTRMRFVRSSTAWSSAVSSSMPASHTKTASSCSAISMPLAACAWAGSRRVEGEQGQGGGEDSGHLEAFVGNGSEGLNPAGGLRLRAVLAVYAAHINADDPLSGLVVGEQPEPDVPAGWTTVTVRAASLNHHDLWSLRGVGLPAERLPMILGCDAAGVDADGREVIVHSVISDPTRGCGDETLDPRRSLLSERHPGTFAERVAVPARNLVPKPPELSWEEAACLPTAWLTAYRMLFTRGRVVPGMTVLVQGAGGGVATALIALGRAAGLRVWATSRSEDKRARAVALGADATFEPGARLPERVDAVMETVGAGDLEPLAEVAQARRRARHLGRDERA